MKRFLHFLFFLILSKVSFAQKLSSLVAEGKTAMENKEYFLAENYFKKAIGIDSTNIELQYLYAEACRLDLNYAVAERWYNKVYKKDNSKIYPDALYHLASCKKSNGRYKDAIKMFDKYAKRSAKKQAEKAAKATQESKNCSYALMLMKNPLPLNVNHIDSNVNSKSGEYGPFEIDSILYFTGINTSKNNIESKIFKSKVSAYKYSKFEALDSTINATGYAISNGVFDQNNSTFYCTRCESNNAQKSNCGSFQNSPKST